MVGWLGWQRGAEGDRGASKVRYFELCADGHLYCFRRLVLTAEDRKGALRFGVPLAKLRGVALVPGRPLAFVLSGATQYDDGTQALT